MARRARAVPRLPVPLGGPLLDLLNQALARSELAQGAVLAIYEARQLTGVYELRVTGARLVPVEEARPR